MFKRSFSELFWYLLLKINRYRIYIMDIKTAVLQREQINREVYIRSPLKGEKNVLWHLNKCIYGLTDTSLNW